MNAAGAPCSGCSLYTYAAGTTNPQATYTDSSGTSQNPNPIVLDVAGGANIWLSTTGTYKLVLIDTLGSTVWSVDNVKSAGGSIPCSTPYAVQMANSSATALTCDSTITIDPVGHSLDVGGSISGPAFTLKNLSTIPASWTFDVTSALSAINSLSPIPVADLAAQAADSVVMNASGANGAPAAVALPSGCTLGVNYDTSTHKWSCASTTVPLANLAAEAADTVVMNATGGSAAPAAVALPSGCTLGVNYDTGTHAWSCLTNTAQPARVCNASGCYLKFADGTIEEWINQYCGSLSCTYNLPIALTQTANSSATCTVGYSAGNLTTVISSFTTTTLAVGSNGVVNVGGSGASYNGGGTYYCSVIGY